PALAHNRPAATPTSAAAKRKVDIRWRMILTPWFVQALGVVCGPEVSEDTTAAFCVRPGRPRKSDERTASRAISGGRRSARARVWGWPRALRGAIAARRRAPSRTAGREGADPA